MHLCWCRAGVVASFSGLAITVIFCMQQMMLWPKRLSLGAELCWGGLLEIGSLCADTAASQRQRQRQRRPGGCHAHADHAQTPAQACQGNHKGSLLKPSQTLFLACTSTWRVPFHDSIQGSMAKGGLTRNTSCSSTLQKQDTRLNRLAE